MPEFSLHIYRSLLESLLKHDYVFVTMEDFLTHDYESDSRVVVMRHDVDRLPHNSVLMARLEHKVGIKATYYFRCVAESYDEPSIREIVSLGHEVGYHYEDMSLCNGDKQAAYRHFCDELQRLRTFYPVRTICMHGAPTSKWDGRDLWQDYDYHQLGIIGEPYFDVDFSRTFYLTDTGRRWDGFKVSVRDKIPHYQDVWIGQGLVYHTTADILRALEAGTLPSHVLFTTHPQRWSDDFWQRQLEFIKQSVKNIIKRMIVK